VDLFDLPVEHRVHGTSLVPLLTYTAEAVRLWALVGFWGREVHLVDERHKYARGPAGQNFPLSMWSNRWSTMPAGLSHLRLPRPDQRAWLDRMPGTKVPVIRQPFEPGDMLPYWALTRFTGNHLYDLANDPAEDENRAGEQLEAELADKLRQALMSIEAPQDQFARLGLE
jgi:hypothetical protein